MTMKEGIIGNILLALIWGGFPFSVCDDGIYFSVTLDTPRVVHLLYTPAYVNHRRSFAAHTSGGPENSWSTSARASMEDIVEPKRSSSNSLMGPQTLCHVFVCGPVMHIATTIILLNLWLWLRFVYIYQV